MDLSFGGFQVAVLTGFLVVSACLVAIFTVVAIQARRNVAYETVSDTGYRLHALVAQAIPDRLASGLAARRKTRYIV